ncbi:unnamed protein product [Brachionus calyciflorus]|uniref:Uncharacterized protein n=1 Tax=Brachionus calyciflorus TaxID=104777 RepID=A0A814IDH0_9BILA|nr:unnamed protein product [Brachionus calyciflorus]
MNQNTSLTNQPGIQGPTYDAYGRPIIVNMTYEQKMDLVHDARRQHKEYVQKRLEENYPKIFAIVYSVIMILIGITSIVLQAILIHNEGILYYVGHGIWGGCICIFLAVLSLLLIKYPKNSLLVCTTVSHGFGMILVLSALSTVNAVGLVLDIFDIFSSFSNDTRGITGAMIGLGIVAFIACIVFLIMICVTTGRSSRAVRNQGGLVYPNNSTTNQNLNTVTSSQMNYAPAYNTTNQTV